MAKAFFLEQASSLLSSSAAYGSTSSSSASLTTPFGIANRFDCARASSSASQPSKSVCSSSSTWTSSRDLSWGRMKQSRQGRNSAGRLLVPASVTAEERGIGKENGAAVTEFRENLISSFQQSASNTTTRKNLHSGRRADEAAEQQLSRVQEQEDPVWIQMREEARQDSEQEPALASYLYSTILAHKSLERALAFHLGNKLSSATFLSTQLVTVFIDTIMEDELIRESIRLDIVAVRERDPACISYAHCLLNFKGFLALQAHRVAHRLWLQGRRSLALAMQSRVSEVFHVDIHPGASVGSGILFDHATGVVVGETAVIGNNVSILHHVTLGGTGASAGDRHPKIGDGVLIGAGATILGNIRVDTGAKIGAGSVVLTNIPAHSTAVGNPARLVGGKKSLGDSKENPSATMDHTSFIAHWSDYVI